MKLQGRVPVEPLEEERLQQIERRIVAGAGERLAQPQRGSRWWIGAAVAMAAAAAIVVWLGRREVAHEPAAPQTFAMRTEQARSIVDLGDVVVTGDPASAVQVTHGDGRVVIEMTRGKIEMAVQHREGRVVIVRAGDTEIEDVGTKFSVEYDGAKRVEVRVTEGKVKVSRQQRSEVVAAGFGWTGERGVVAIAELDRTTVAATATGTGSATATGTGSATATATGSGSGSGSGTGTGTVAAGDFATRAGSGAIAMRSHDVATPHDDAAHPVARPRVETHETARPEHSQHEVAADPYVDLKTAVRAQPIAWDPRIDGLGDAAAEIAKLKPVAYAPQKYGDEASAALYEMAVLLYKPLHQDAEALRTVDFYLRRFTSKSREHGAALWLRVRITCGRAIDEECRHAAYAYQHEITEGPAAAVAIRITNSP